MSNIQITREMEHLMDLVSSGNYSVIAIDGNDGVGKSTLADALSKKFGYKHINLDNFLSKKKGGYLKYLNFKNIEAEVRKRSNKKIVIEGVLMKKVLEEINVDPDMFIYISDNVWIYQWSEEYDGEYSKMTFEEIIKDVEDKTNRISRIVDSNPKIYKLNGLQFELYEYAFKCKPWESADLVYVR